MGSPECTDLHTETETEKAPMVFGDHDGDQRSDVGDGHTDSGRGDMSAPRGPTCGRCGGRGP